MKYNNFGFGAHRISPLHSFYYSINYDGDLFHVESETFLIRSLSDAGINSENGLGNIVY